MNIVLAALTILLAPMVSPSSLPSIPRTMTRGPDFTVELKNRETWHFKFGISGHVFRKIGNNVVPMPGLLVYAKDPKSEHIYSSDRTHKDGKYLLPVPKRGAYVVVLDQGIGTWLESSTPRASIITVK